MIFTSHIAGGYLAVKLVSKLKSQPLLRKSGFLMIGIAGAVVPDADYFFYTHIKDHHNSLLHSPMFWLFCYLMAQLVFLAIPRVRRFRMHINVFALGVLTHMFLDWYAARTAGIRIFYPFLDTRYSLFPLNPEAGQVGTTSNVSSYTEFFKFYAENTFLLISEVALVITAVGVWLSERFKNKPAK